MSKEQFTPGPWDIKICLSRPDGYMAFRIERMNENDSIRTVATKNLIAAAPDMYDALKNMVKLDNHADYCGLLTPSLKEVRAKAIAALNKATGK